MRIISWVIFLIFLWTTGTAQPRQPYSPLEIGYSTGIKSITEDEIAQAKAAGISSLQISLNGLVDKEGNLNLSDEEIIDLSLHVRKILEKFDIKVGSFHMPFGQAVDLSLINEIDREKVVDLHIKLLELCASLQPKVVLFHPSWYLSLGQREEHSNKLIKSIMELRPSVKKLGSVLVVENMTGPELYVVRKNIKYERPLFRTVEEMKELLNKMPSDVYGAVDLNHILEPEKLILALGDRLRFIHVADGDGENEKHYFPCSGKGMNDWNAIFDALYQVGYNGPFMYECHYKDLNDLTVCFHSMYNDFLLQREIKPKYK